MENVSLLSLSPSQLRRAAEIKDQIDRLNNELGQVLTGEIGGRPHTSARGGGGRRQMSAEGKARIAAAARARWAKVRAAKNQGGTAPAGGNGGKGKRTMSA